MSSSENTSVSEKTASFYSALDAARDFAALLALTIWGVYVFERMQVGDRSPLNPIKILGVAYLLIYLPGRLANAFRSVAPVLSESLISLLVLVTAPILGWLSGPAMGALFAWPMAAGGFVLAGMSLAGLWRKSSRRNTVMMLCVGTLVSIRMVSCVYGEFFINPIMVEGLLYGEGHALRFS